MQNCTVFVIFFLKIVCGFQETLNSGHYILHIQNEKQLEDLCPKITSKQATLYINVYMSFNNPKLYFQLLNSHKKFAKIFEERFLKGKMPKKTDQDQNQRINMQVQMDRNIEIIFPLDQKKIIIEIYNEEDNILSQCKLELLGQVLEEYSSEHYILFRGISCGLILITLIALISLNYDYFTRKISTMKFSVLAVLVSTTQQQLLYDYFYFSDVLNIDHHEYYFYPLIMQEVAYIFQLVFVFMLVKRYYRLSVPTMICLLISYMFLTQIYSLWLRNFILYRDPETQGIYIFQFILPFPIQIIQNAFKRNSLSIFKLNYIFVLSIKLLFMFYFYGCPQNDAYIQVNHFYCAILFVLFVIFMILFYFQNKIGPLFFIGQRLVVDILEPDNDPENLNQPFIEAEPLILAQPLVINYDFLIQTIKINNFIDCCPICLSSLLLDPNEDDKKLEVILLPLQKSLMITPCQHQFHISCLTSWLKLQKGCPICRKIVFPQIN